MCHAVDIILTMVYDKIITGVLDVFSQKKLSFLNKTLTKPNHKDKIR